MYLKSELMFKRFNLCIMLIFLFVLSNAQLLAVTNNGGWQTVPKILASIEEPQFPSQDFLVTDYGGCGDGKKDNTDSIKKAISGCHQAGGGRVVISEGIFMTGAIHLKSNVNLHLSRGAILKFSRDKKKYLPVVFTRFEGTECYNYSPFIYAFDQDNVAVTGNGVLDGQAGDDNWWSWKGDERWGYASGMPNQNQAVEAIRSFGNEGVPVEKRVFGEGHYLRPNFVQPYKCSNVLIEDITIINSPMWVIHPVLCENVTVRNIKVRSHGPNSDGCDPESCKNVLIENCYFDTADDCIAIKAGRDLDGRSLNKPSQNIIIRDCVMRDGHGGVVFGSEMSGGIKNVYVEDCIMDSPNLKRGIRLKSNSLRGGYLENIFVRNIIMGEIYGAVLDIDLFYDGQAGPNYPSVNNVLLENVTSEKSKYAVYLRGPEESLIQNIVLKNCALENVQRPSVIENVQDLYLVNFKMN